jgi:hypothetical protein
MQGKFLLLAYRKNVKSGGILLHSEKTGWVNAQNVDFMGTLWHYFWKAHESQA